MQDGFDPDLPLIADDFNFDASNRGQRTVRDVEGVVSVHHDGLRISPLATVGWNRAAVQYGGHQRRDGLALAVGLLNGHNGSEPFRQTSLLRQTRRGTIGSGTDPLLKRLIRLPFRLKRESLYRRLECWVKARRPAATAAGLGGNLGIGWFDEESPADPGIGGNAFIVQGAGPTNGRVLARTDGHLLPVAEQVPNIPIGYVIILRADGGAAYYLAMENAGNDGGYLRPVAIDAGEKSGTVHPGLQQSVVGEIGFSVDTRVYGVRVAHLSRYGQWYGTAHTADRFDGGAVRGGPWHSLEDGSTVLRPPAPSGLIHVVVKLSEAGSIGIVWRGWDGKTGVRLRLDSAGATLQVIENGATKVERHAPAGGLSADRRHAIQIQDDGQTIRIARDGRSLEPLTIDDPTGSDSPEIGLAGLTGGIVVEAFEAHPRQIPWPTAIKIDLPTVERGEEIVIHEDFQYHRDNLAGGIWHRLVGKGAIRVMGAGAEMVASAENPAPGRLLYGVDWSDPGFADLTAVIVPPILKPGSGANSRAGVVFWQDDDNYVIVNLWLNGGDTSMPEVYGSVSCFFYLNGFEDVYDAVWTNVGDALRHGRPAELRVACDGMRIMAWLDGRPVLYRALTDVYRDAPPLRIDRVGLGVNWEWGVDTGSRFTSFTARRRAERRSQHRSQR